MADLQHDGGSLEEGMDGGVDVEMGLSDVEGIEPGRKGFLSGIPGCWKIFFVLVVAFGMFFVTLSMSGGRKTEHLVHTEATRPRNMEELKKVGVRSSEEMSRKTKDYADMKSGEAAREGRTYVPPIVPDSRPVVYEDPLVKVQPAPDPPKEVRTPPQPQARRTRTPEQSLVVRARPTRAERADRGDQTMMGYMAKLDARWDRFDPAVAVVLNNAKPRMMERPDAKEGRARESAKVLAAGNAAPPGVKPGDILYCVNRVTLDSDAPGPAMVEVIDGPYTGAKAIGAFTRMNEHLTLTFSQLVMPSGLRYAITGYAMDPRTDRTAVRSSVNSHAFERWFKYAAAKFLEGFGEIVSTQGSSGYSTAYGSGYTRPKLNLEEQIWTAAGKVGEGAARVFERDFGVPPTVTLASGTEMGVLVVQVGRAEAHDADSRKYIEAEQQDAKRAGAAAYQPVGRTSGPGVYVPRQGEAR
jgi:intracellular multiplication protein IcmE